MCPERLPRPQPVDAPTLFWAMEKLAVGFPASFGTDAKRQGAVDLMRDLLDQHRWVTRDVFVGAVFRIAWEHPGPFLPGPRRVLEFCVLARDGLRREQEAARLRLSEPAPPSEREVAEARLRSEAAKAAARAMLPERLRGTPPRRSQG